ncbi:hypothetical protein [Leptospira borgpetersenii]|uniref:hypothetical protein n=1 Tax=Leptospira borgpetersenii TaxID=174 RepID=UPI0027E46A00|nr:hypothetical protein [Leptospira borgpetersenii]
MCSKTRKLLKSHDPWELPRKLDNNKTYSKIDDRQKGRELPFYEKFKMNISVEVLRPALSSTSFKSNQSILKSGIKS